MSCKIDLKALEKTLRGDGWTMNATDYILNAVETHDALWDVFKRLSQAYRNWHSNGHDNRSVLDDILRQYGLTIAKMNGGTI